MISWNVTELFADHSELTQSIKRRPLAAVAIGAAMGFVWAGGMGGRLRRAVLLFMRAR